MNQKLRESHEQRLLGASFVLARKTFSKGVQVLLMQDTAKIEVSAGFTRWLKASSPAWSYPGGGRSVNNDGIQETRSQTLQSELKEEINLLLSLSFLDTGEVQKVPFLVGQMKKDLIHQIGVTSALYWFDELGQSERRFIEENERKGFLWWNELEQIVCGYQASLSIQERISELQFRPHLYTTSFLWYLDLVQKLSPDEIREKINVLNRYTRQFLLKEAENLNISIQNGAFKENGDIILPHELNESDANFLYDLAKNRKIK